MIGRPAHCLAELADPRAAGRDPVAQGAGFLEFAQEGGTATQPVELFWRLTGVFRHGRTSSSVGGKGALGGGLR